MSVWLRCLTVIALAGNGFAALWNAIVVGDLGPGLTQEHRLMEAVAKNPFIPPASRGLD